MNKLCKQVAGGTPSDEIRALGINAYSDSLRRVAGTFADLQEERHTADYDLADFYSRAEVQTLIQRVEESFVLWTSIRDSPETEIFLAALLFARRWSK